MSEDKETGVILRECDKIELIIKKKKIVGSMLWWMFNEHPMIPVITVEKEMLIKKEINK